MLKREAYRVNFFLLPLPCNSNIKAKSSCANFAFRRTILKIFCQYRNESIRWWMFTFVIDATIHNFTIKFHECSVREELTVL